MGNNANISGSGGSKLGSLLRRALKREASPAPAPQDNAVTPAEMPPSQQQVAKTPEPELPALDSLKNFSPRARSVFVTAQKEARKMSVAEVGTEHLLLAMLMEDDGMAKAVLDKLGVKQTQVRAVIPRLAGRQPTKDTSQLQLAPDTERALEAAADYSRRLGHHYIGTEHLLLGVAQDKPSAAAVVLMHLDVSSDDIRDCVQGLFGDRIVLPQQDSKQKAMSPGPPDSIVPPDLLSQLTERAKGDVLKAKADAIAMHHTEVGTDHLLLAMSGGTGIARQVLNALGVDEQRIRTQIPYVNNRSVVHGSLSINLAPDLTRALEQTKEEARALGKQFVDSEHLLLGVVSNPKSSGTFVLNWLNITADQVRAQISKEIAPQSPAPNSPEKPPEPKSNVSPPDLAPMVTPQTIWHVGQVVAGTYTIVKELGRGGMGVVHLAREGQVGRLVAIKSPQGDFFNDALARRRYAREATAWLELGSHPHIVRAFDVQEVDYLPRIVMAYCDQGALTNLIAQHPRGLPFQQVYDIASQICWGLDHAHQHGLVHRDLKPDNVLLHTEDGRVTAKVTDFGLVRPAGAVAQDMEGANGGRRAEHVRKLDINLSGGGVGWGTDAYMAPEQFSSAEVSAAVDIYALGLIVFELLTGQRAFDVRTHPFCRGMDIAPNHKVAFYKLLHQQHEPLDAMALRADLPAGVWRLVRECLAKRPADRPEGARAVALRLARELSVVKVAATWRVEAGQDERDAQSQREHAWALVRLGNGALSRGDLVEAQQSYERALAIFTGINDRAGLSWCCVGLGNIHFSRSASDEAMQWYEQAIAIQREIGDRAGLSDCYQNLGIVFKNRGAYDEAVRWYEQAIAIKREIGDRSGLASCYVSLGIVHADRGASDEAVRLFEQSIAIFREIGNRNGLAGCYQGLGVVHMNRGAYNEAVRWYEQAIAIQREIGDRKGLAGCYQNLGNVHRHRGAYDEAVRLYEQAIAIKREIGDDAGLARSYQGLGAVHWHRGAYDEARRLYEQAIAIMREIGDR